MKNTVKMMAMLKFINWSTATPCSVAGGVPYEP